MTKGAKSQKKSQNKKSQPQQLNFRLRIPKWLIIIIIIISTGFIYLRIINPAIHAKMAKVYLENKYNKEFSVREGSGARWIGQKPTYYGLAKTDTNYGEIEFVVACATQENRCSDTYLDDLVSKAEEHKIRSYFSNLIDGLEVKAFVATQKGIDYNNAILLENTEYYFHKYKAEIRIVVDFTGSKDQTNKEHAKKVLDKFIEYLRHRGVIGSAYYFIKNNESNDVCRIELKKEGDTEYKCYKPLTSN